MISILIINTVCVYCSNIVFYQCIYTHETCWVFGENCIYPFRRWNTSTDATVIFTVIHQTPLEGRERPSRQCPNTQHTHKNTYRVNEIFVFLFSSLFAHSALHHSSRNAHFMYFTLSLKGPCFFFSDDYVCTNFTYTQSNVTLKFITIFTKRACKNSRSRAGRCQRVFTLIKRTDTNRKEWVVSWFDNDKTSSRLIRLIKKK